MSVCWGFYSCLFTIKQSQLLACSLFINDSVSCSTVIRHPGSCDLCFGVTRLAVEPTTSQSEGKHPTTGPLGGASTHYNNLD